MVQSSTRISLAQKILTESSKGSRAPVEVVSPPSCARSSRNLNAMLGSRELQVSRTTFFALARSKGIPRARADDCMRSKCCSKRSGELFNTAIVSNNPVALGRFIKNADLIWHSCHSCCASESIVMPAPTPSVKVGVSVASSAWISSVLIGTLNAKSPLGSSHPRAPQ